VARDRHAEAMMILWLVERELACQEPTFRLNGTKPRCPKSDRQCPKRVQTTHLFLCDSPPIDPNADCKFHVEKPVKGLSINNLYKFPWF